MMCANRLLQVYAWSGVRVAVMMHAVQGVIVVRGHERGEESSLLEWNLGCVFWVVITLGPEIRRARDGVIVSGGEGGRLNSHVADSDIVLYSVFLF